MGVNIIAMIWGFAEATLFFIVPDVWLTIISKDKLLVGIKACAFSLCGALVGGFIMYQWGSIHGNALVDILDSIPGISHDMVMRVHSDLTEKGIIAIFWGPVSGTPYKIYAAQAAIANIAIWQFLLISIPARFFRFLLLTIVSHYVIKGLKHLGIKANFLYLILMCWAVFYTIYFIII